MRIVAISAVQLALQYFVGEGFGKLRPGLGVTGEALFVFSHRRGGLSRRMDAMAAEAGYLTVAMAGTDAADLAWAVFVTGETSGLTRRGSKLARIANFRRVSGFSVLGRTAVAGIATLLGVRVAIAGKCLDDILVTSGASFPLGIFSLNHLSDQEQRNGKGPSHLACTLATANSPLAPWQTLQASPRMEVFNRKCEAASFAT